MFSRKSSNLKFSFVTNWIHVNNTLVYTFNWESWFSKSDQTHFCQIISWLFFGSNKFQVDQYLFFELPIVMNIHFNVSVQLRELDNFIIYYAVELLVDMSVRNNFGFLKIVLFPEISNEMLLSETKYFVGAKFATYNFYTELT